MKPQLKYILDDRKIMIHGRLGKEVFNDNSSTLLNIY